MDKQNFISLYESEKSMYQAWADYVLSEIKDKLLEKLGSKAKYDELVKIPPSSRVKDVNSLVAKAFIRKKGKYADPYNEITDKAGIRFVVLLTNQLELLSDIIEESDSWSFSKDKEFDEWRKKDVNKFDYQSVHYIVRAKEDFLRDDIPIKKETPCEVQFRTLLQHAYAELAHDTIYKGEGVKAPEIVRIFARSMALMETTDDLLCKAKEALDSATTSLTEWQTAVTNATKEKFNDIKEDVKSTDFLIGKLEPLLKETDTLAFLNFINDKNNEYIYQKIQRNAEEIPEFQYSFILLIYFLSSKFQNRLHEFWPLESDILQRIYSDLGLKPRWAAT